MDNIKQIDKKEEEPDQKENKEFLFSVDNSLEEIHIQNVDLGKEEKTDNEKEESQKEKEEALKEAQELKEFFLLL